MTPTPAPSHPSTWRNARNWAAPNRPTHLTRAGTRIRALRCSARAANAKRRRSSSTHRPTHAIATVPVVIVAVLFLAAMFPQSTPAVYVLLLAGLVAWWASSTASVITTPDPDTGHATATITVIRGHGCIEVSNWAYLPHDGPESLTARRAAYDLARSLLTWADEHSVVLVGSAANPTLSQFYRDCGFIHEPTREHHAGRITRTINWLMHFEPTRLRYPGTPLPNPRKAFARFAR